MNSFQIFADRVKKDYLFQYSMIKIVIDWIIMLYLVVPSAIIAIVIYRSWWMELPTWSEYLSKYILISIFYFITWFGSYRTFVKEADGIYFIKHTTKFLNMKKWAFAFSLGRSAFNISLSVMIALPFLINRFSFTILEIVGFALFYMGLSFFIIFIKTVIRSNFSGWKEKMFFWLLLIILFICNLFIFSFLVLHPPSSFVSAITFIGLSLGLTIPKVSTTRSFQGEVLKEDQERLRYLNMIFSASPDIEKPKISKRKKPFLFRQSMRILEKRTAQNGFFELFLKINLRNLTYLRSYLQMLGVTGAAILIVPPVLFKLIILIGFAVFIWIWITNLWDKLILSHPNSKKYETHDSFHQARLKANLVFSLPAISILSIYLLVTIILR